MRGKRSGGPPKPERLSSFLELFALTGLVVAQPVLSSFGDSPETFVGYGAGLVDIVAFAMVVALVPALLLWGIEQLVGLTGPRARRGAHLIAVFVVFTGLALQVGKEVSDLGYKRLPLLAAAVALGLTAVVWRSALARLFLRFLAAAPVAFAVLFLVASPVSAIAFADGGDEEDAVSVGKPAPVVMIVFDELPTVSLLDAEGSIDRRSYPAFASFAEDATWYRNSTTVAQETVTAVPALLTGRVPPDGGVAPIASEYERSLFTMLRGSRELHATEPATQLCSSCQGARGSSEPTALPALVSDALELWRGQISPSRSERERGLDIGGAFFQRALRRAVSDIGAFTSSLGPVRGRPRLDFLHVLLPHQPWRYLPSGAAHNADEATRGAAFGAWLDEPSAVTGRQRHLLQLAYTDALLGRIFHRMKELGTYDESLVVVTADHGVAFVGNESVRAATEATYAEVAWTPLLIKAPGQRDGERSDVPARSVDVLPTIADHLDVDLSWKFDGSSLLGGRQRDDGRLELVAAPSFLFGSQKQNPVFDRREGFQRVLEGAPSHAPGRPELRSYRLGRLGELIGRSVDGLRSGGSADFGGRLDDPDALEEVDLDDEEHVANYIAGEVESGRPLSLAVSVNGVIGGWSGTTRKYGDPEDFRRLGVEVDQPEGAEDVYAFQTFVPPSLLRDGRNDIQVFVVEGGADDARLVRVPLD